MTESWSIYLFLCNCVHHLMCQLGSPSLGFICSNQKLVRVERMQLVKFSVGKGSWKRSKIFFRLDRRKTYAISLALQA